MITRFRVQNYKALRDVTLELTPMHLLIGPNDSGKTSILEALAALCRSVDRGLAQAFTGPWTGNELVWNRSRDEEVSLHACLQNADDMWVYKLACRFGSSDRKAAVCSEVITSGAGKDFDLGGGGESDSRVFRVARLNEKASNDETRLILATYDSLVGLQFYRWIPQHLALPVAPDSNRRFRMEPSGFGLALCLDDILGYDRDRFNALEQRFIAIFPQIESIKLITEPAFKAPVDDPKQVLVLKPSDGKGIHFQFDSNTTPIPASQVSDGMLLVLAYLAILYLPKPPRVLLIEEPENGIHPARLQEVLAILRDLVKEQSQTQVVLTSHSPYVVSMFEPQEVTLCHKGNDGAVKVRRLSESEMVHKQKSFFTLGEIWTGEGDDALMEPATTGVDVP